MVKDLNPLSVAIELIKLPMTGYLKYKEQAISRRHLEIAEENLDLSYRSEGRDLQKLAITAQRYKYEIIERTEKLFTAADVESTKRFLRGAGREDTFGYILIWLKMNGFEGIQLSQDEITLIANNVEILDINKIINTYFAGKTNNYLNNRLRALCPSGRLESEGILLNKKIGNLRKRFLELQEDLVNKKGSTTIRHYDFYDDVISEMENIILEDEVVRQKLKDLDIEVKYNWFESDSSCISLKIDPELPSIIMELLIIRWFLDTNKLDFDRPGFSLLELCISPLYNTNIQKASKFNPFLQYLIHERERVSKSSIANINFFLALCSRRRACLICILSNPKYQSKIFESVDLNLFYLFKRIPERYILRMEKDFIKQILTSYKYLFWRKIIFEKSSNIDILYAPEKHSLRDCLMYSFY